MNSVAICIITHDNPIETAFFIDRLIEVTNQDFSLYVYDRYTGNQDMKKMLMTATNQTKGRYEQIDVNKTTNAQIYNSMLTKMYEDYGVFMSINFLVNEGWLTDLIYYNKSIKNSGCSSISSCFQNVTLSSALFDDETLLEPITKTIWVNDTNTLNEFVFFSKKAYEEKSIGFFDLSNKLKGLELSEWSFRFLANGLFNYYIGQNSGIKYKIEDEILFPSIKNVGKKELLKLINKTASVNNQINGL